MAMQNKLFNDEVVADAVRCADGWHARIIHWLTCGNAEVFECPYADMTESVALQRAQALAGLRYPELPTLH
jgi:hypothetical protein